MALAAHLLTNLAVSALCFAALWLVSVRLRDPSFVDSWWALGVVVLAALATAWGLRLGLYLLWRWRKHGADRRYKDQAATAREKHGLGFATFALLWVFAPQMLLQFVVALPAQLGQIGALGELRALAIAGAVLSAFGILYEAIADRQLAHFKANAANSGKVMDRGLWRYSRHPNYFGELCAWWGMYLVALETPLGAWSLPDPLLLTFLLTRVSGAPTTEPHLQRSRPDYDAYKKRTSAFMPLPPRR